MNYRKELIPEIALRLKKMRKVLGHSGPQMADALGIRKSSYYRNEKGQSSPDLWTYHYLGRYFGVNLNWLIYGHGEMFIKEEVPRQKGDPVLESPAPEVLELLKHMKKIPSLHHEVLACFHHFKEEHVAVVEREMKK